MELSSNKVPSPSKWEKTSPRILLASRLAGVVTEEEEEVEEDKEVQVEDPATDQTREKNFS